jgi:serine-type D-Ala-D-Ala endopeptidase (penicillin-binding protein 7)
LPRIHLRAILSTLAKKKTAYYLFGAIWGIAALFSLTRSDQSVAHSNPSLKSPQYNTENPLKPYLDPNRLFLRSGVALVMDEGDGSVLLDKNIHVQRPIASLTKLMTAMVALDSNLPRDEAIAITRADRDRLRGSKSRLSFGTKLTRRDLLKISLAASENRAASALARTYPGGKEAFVSAMNEKARKLGMKQTAFRDAAGLHSDNVSTAADLSILVAAAYRYPLIREFSTTGIDSVTDLRSGWKIEFVNTNRLVRGNRWNIDLSKTGYIADAGHCLVMRANIADRPVVMVLLNSWGTLSKFGDANRIRKWLDQANRKAQQA